MLKSLKKTKALFSKLGLLGHSILHHILNLHNMNPEEIWNTRYSKTQYAYGKAPNEFFEKELEKLPPTSILFPAEGEGRNAVHALRKGWNVVAFDSSNKGRDKAIALAQEHGVILDYRVEDAQFFECPKVEAIVYCYFHIPKSLKENLYTRLNSFLSDNGALIFEGFSYKNVGMGSGGPQKEGMCFTTQEVQVLFSDFKAVKVWEERVKLTEGEYHNGEAWVIRAIGTK